MIVTKKATKEVVNLRSIFEERIDRLAYIALNQGKQIEITNRDKRYAEIDQSIIMAAVMFYSNAIAIRSMVEQRGVGIELPDMDLLRDKKYIYNYWMLQFIDKGRNPFTAISMPSTEGITMAE